MQLLPFATVAFLSFGVLLSLKFIADLEDILMKYLSKITDKYILSICFFTGKSLDKMKRRQVWYNIAIRL
ncbi:hypothetical protein BJL90_20935 [Clostridium formicaceticum]|uniref:Uncharacterized protein n=1 Tax=Clostridium formicaceticum TaxID=1497 RepID=A0ABN4TBK4_9CLOT|nr:hypothetical protein BJL90_20935 [Clostridium formicaceticum]